ncbi:MULTISPECIES: bifunctional DNA primase/polymerase [unclassified Streptomyces]|uniref:bifunctional DNA primase/polymerase n=1 Tax=unclassified Streptomyces TaxID=2593676 RepID=UPI0005A69DB0|nr:bifunctional DNA primase/polymerase [Streptomyces sp. NBC_00370]
MTAWLRDESPLSPGTSDDERRTDIFGLLRDEGSHQTGQVTPAGADWLASAGPCPRSTLSLWAARPTAPGVLPCGSAFDVVNTPAMFGRRMLDRLWGEGPGSGPVAVHRGRTLLFAAPGTAQRLPALLSWEEWGCAADDEGQEAGVPPLLCHGTGDAVTVPPLTPGATGAAAGPRWVVAPDTRHPWLPGPEVLLWACVRAVRSAARATLATTAGRLPRSCS